MERITNLFNTIANKLRLKLPEIGEDKIPAQKFSELFFQIAYDYISNSMVDITGGGLNNIKKIKFYIDTEGNNTVTTINENAFTDFKIEEVEFNESIKSIKKNAFKNCKNIHSITIPSNVIEIGSNAFEGCEGLTSIIVEDENEIYDSRDNCNAIIETETGTLISGCPTTIIPNSVTKIGDNAFAYMSNMNKIVDISEGVISIGNRAFVDCSTMKGINFPTTLEEICRGAFYYCENISSITIPNSLISIKSGVFRACSKLKTINIYNIEHYCKLELSDYFAAPTCNGASLYYNDEKIEEIVIPDSISDIKSYAFYNCKGITKIKFPAELKSINAMSFSNCTDMKIYDFTQLSAVPLLYASSAFENPSSEMRIVVPDNLYDSWIETTTWTAYGPNGADATKKGKIISKSEYEQLNGIIL